MESISISVAFGGGLLTFISPCVIPMIPIYIGNMAGAASLQDSSSKWPPFLHSICFVLGFSSIFILLGVSAGLIGMVISPGILRVAAGSMIIVFGILLLASRRIRWLNYEKRLLHISSGSNGYIRSILLGAAFALGWTPCITPILGVILSLASSSQTAWTGMYLLIFYSIGLGIPFITVGLALGRATPVIRWLSRHGNIISLISGLLLITVGILLLTNKLGLLQI